MVYSRGLVQDDRYFYMNDLLLLNAHKPVKDVSHLVISKEVCSPLRAWVDEVTGENQ